VRKKISVAMPLISPHEIITCIEHYLKKKATKTVAFKDSMYLHYSAEASPPSEEASEDSAGASSLAGASSTGASLTSAVSA
jgi:hypothetical protein